MSDLQALAGRCRIPHVTVELAGQEEIRAGIERMQGLWLLPS